MSDQQDVDKGRRSLLIATSVVGGVGGVTVAAPFVYTFVPSEKARAASAPVEADVGDLAPGRIKMVEWRGKPVWLFKRTPDMLKSLKKTDNEVANPKSDVPFAMKTPDYCKNKTRSRAKHRGLLVVVGICSRLGCSPSGSLPASAGVQLAKGLSLVCPCHGSTFDLAGRVFKNKPTPRNPNVPPRMFLSNAKLVIGKDRKEEV